MFSVCLKTGVAVHVPLVSLSFLRKKQNPTKPQGPKKTVQAFFFSVFVIVKSSDWTRSRRKAGKTWEWRGGKCPRWVLLRLPLSFLARKSRYQGTKGEKCKTKPERWDRKTGKQKTNPPKVERLVIQRANWGTGQRKCPCARPPAVRV